MQLSLRSFLKQTGKNINGVIHVGGHFGQEYWDYKTAGIQNIVFFEPVPSSFEVLRKQVPENVICYNVALGNSNTRIQMNIETANSGQSSSVLVPKLHLVDYPHITFLEKITVDMFRLDDFLQNPKEYNFMNIDVQGYELEVLKGSTNLLKTINYVVCEVNNCELYENGTLHNEITDFLSEHGLDLIEINWLAKSWGNAYYARNWKINK